MKEAIVSRWPWSLVTAEVTATTPHNDSPGLTAATAHSKLVASHQVAALN
jgi:hypothetical protein